MTSIKSNLNSISFCYQVSYQAGLREAYRSLKDHTERQQRGQVVDASGQFDHAAQNAMATRIRNLTEKMSTDLTSESERLGSWGVLGQGTGAQLLNGSTPLSREDIVGKFNFMLFYTQGTKCKSLNSLKEEF